MTLSIGKKFFLFSVMKTSFWCKNWLERINWVLRNVSDRWRHWRKNRWT